MHEKSLITFGPGFLLSWYKEKAEYKQGPKLIFHLDLIFNKSQTARQEDKVLATKTDNSLGKTLL